jgi:hypothetical protein
MKRWRPTVWQFERRLCLVGGLRQQVQILKSHLAETYEYRITIVAERGGELDPHSFAVQCVGVLIGSPSSIAGKLPWSLGGSETAMSWGPFNEGSTIGAEGSEGGIILRDVEHPLGSRITLERGGAIAPYSVTCGIYGWFFHTRFLGSEAEANLPAMQDGLVAILGIIPNIDDPESDTKMRAAGEAIGEFVDRFP